MAFHRIIIPILALTVATAAVEKDNIDRVIIVGLDGVSATGIDAADTPHIDRLMREGSHTHAMRAVMPTASLPNWASFLMGAGPEQHGITDNHWRADRHALSPSTLGPGGSLPTVFALIRHHRPDWKTAAYLDWEPISRFLEHAAVDVLFIPSTGKNTTESRVRRTEETMDRLIQGLRNEEASFSFIHLDSPDHFGHKFRWESSEYLESITHIDWQVGRLLGMLDDAGLVESTLLIVVSDHGGVGSGHGGATDAEVFVPWVIRGPGIRSGMDLGPFARVQDTAATVAAALGARQPAAWTGRPLRSAFDGHPVPEVTGPPVGTVPAKTGERVEVRVSATAPEDLAVELAVDWGDGQPIRWLPPVASEETRVFTHRYQRPGTYIARARAAAGGESISDATTVGVFEIAPDPAVPDGLVGLWEFTDAEDPTRATRGMDLVIEGRPPEHHATRADRRAQPCIANGVIVTASGPGNHLRARHHIGANGHGARTNRYTLLFDVMAPGEGGWHSFYQTDLENRTDAEFFIRGTRHGDSPADSIGRGDIGYGAAALARDRWHRIVITADLTAGGGIRSFVDGQPHHGHSLRSLDGHGALDPRDVLLFADQDGENTALVVATIAIFDHALDAQTVRMLGGAGDPVLLP